MTATIPALAQACRLHSKVTARKLSTQDDERAYRALLLQAVAAGATRVQIQASCGIDHSYLDSELKKARSETTDPKLRKAKLPHRGLTEGTYWCPERGCTRAHREGNEPFASSQALALHRTKMHGYFLGENRLTEQMVRDARADDTTPTSDLARQYGVSYHALRAARSHKTWRSLDA